MGGGRRKGVASMSALVALTAAMADSGIPARARPTARGKRKPPAKPPFNRTQERERRRRQIERRLLYPVARPIQ